MYVLSPVCLSLTLAPDWLRERIAKTCVPMMESLLEHDRGFTHLCDTMLAQHYFCSFCVLFRASSGLVRRIKNVSDKKLKGGKPHISL